MHTEAETIINTTEEERHYIDRDTLIRAQYHTGSGGLIIDTHDSMHPCGGHSLHDQSTKQ